MKILIIGDIFGQEGVRYLQENFVNIKNQLSPDLIIANCENVSNNGKSVSKEDYDTLKSLGINYFTSGNHIFKNKEIFDFVDKVDDIVVPANFVISYPGKKFNTFTFRNKIFLLFNLLGQTFMNDIATSPFEAADKILKENEYDIAILDFHAETTSEKLILSNYLKDRVSIFYGTHTHVQTSDERIIDNKLAYITDVGMTGVLNSSIGMNFQEIENKIRLGTREKFKEAFGLCRFNAILVTIDEHTNKPTNIQRISIDEK